MWATRQRRRRTRRLADGAAGIRSERGDSHVGGDGCGRAAARTAGNALGIDGIAHRAVSGVLVRGAHRELIAVGLTENDSARSLKARNNRGVIGRMVALENLRTCGRYRALGDEDILDADRNAGERRKRITFGGQRVDALGLRESALFGEAQVDVEVRIFLVDAFVSSRPRGRQPSLGAQPGRRAERRASAASRCRSRLFSFQSASAIPFAIS